jgi:hypothetical protein
LNQVLDMRAKAIAAGDAKAYFDLFAPDYYDDDAWLTMDLARQKIGERMKSAPLPIITFGKRKIEFAADKARVDENYTLEDKIEGRPRRYQGAQHLLLEKRDKGWVVKSGDEVLKLLAGQLEAEYRIEEVILRREEALVKEDILTYMNLISPSYDYEGQSPETFKAKLLQIFRIHDNITFKSFDRKIEYHGKTAIVEQRYSMQTVMMGENQTFSDKERFELELTKDGWKFTKGL